MLMGTHIGQVCLDWWLIDVIWRSRNESIFSHAINSGQSVIVVARK
jgi:hypothetical protein